MNTYVTIHRLFSLPVSLPVRGADGLAKRAHYGGSVRQRLSSQSFKAHLRSGTRLSDTMAELATRIGQSMSVRSALIGERRIAPRLVEKGMEETGAKEWAEAVMALFRSGKDKSPPKKAKKGDAEDSESEEAEAAPKEEAGRQIVVLGEGEIEALATLAATASAAGVKATELRNLVEKRNAAKGLSAEVRRALDAYQAMRGHVGLDGALFGRMATGVAVSRVDSAVHVGHGLTVHPIQSTVDFFSAQDDLLNEDEAGTAHINTRELTTGVYYVPVVIDLGQLKRNIVGLSDEQYEEIIGWLVKAVSTVTPAALLGSTAAFADPGEVVVTVSARQPISMMAAFEKPVAATLDAAVKAFDTHAARVWAMVGRPEAVLRLSELIDPAARKPAVERLAEEVSKQATMVLQPAAAALAAE